VASSARAVASCLGMEGPRRHAALGLLEGMINAVSRCSNHQNRSPPPRRRPEGRIPTTAPGPPHPTVPVSGETVRELSPTCASASSAGRRARPSDARDVIGRGVQRFFARALLHRLGTSPIPSDPAGAACEAPPSQPTRVSPCQRARSRRTLRPRTALGPVAPVISVSDLTLPGARGRASVVSDRPRRP
jgi:hypothetical protein